MKNMFVIQLIGMMAYTTLGLSYLQKKKRNILLVEIISYMLFSLHFYLLNGITGAICNLIGLSALVTIYLFEKYKLENKNLLALIFIGLILIINIKTYQNIYSIFPMIALTTVIVSFLFNNENRIRITGIVSAVCWLIYGIAYNSYVSAIFNIIIISNIIYSLYKNTKKKRKRKTRKN